MMFATNRSGQINDARRFLGTRLSQRGIRLNGTTHTSRPTGAERFAGVAARSSGRAKPAGPPAH